MLIISLYADDASPGALLSQLPAFQQALDQAKVWADSQGVSYHMGGKKGPQFLAYLKKGKLSAKSMGRGYAWLDAGTHEAMVEATQFIASLEKRQGLKICCPEEISFLQGWIGKREILMQANLMGNSSYAKYLKNLAEIER